MKHPRKFKRGATLVVSASVAALIATWAYAGQPSRGKPAVSCDKTEERNARICQLNLEKIAAAKEQYALELKAAKGTTVTMQPLLIPRGAAKIGQGYLMQEPKCPSGGTYHVNAIGEPPTCSVGKSKAPCPPHELQKQKWDQPKSSRKTMGTLDRHACLQRGEALRSLIAWPRTLRCANQMRLGISDA